MTITELIMLQASGREPKQYQLEQDIVENGVTYPKGSKYKVFETTDYGWLVFEPSENIPASARRIFQY